MDHWGKIRVILGLYRVILGYIVYRELYRDSTRSIYGLYRASGK